MQTLKKIFAMVLAVLFVVSLFAACTKTDTDTQEQADTSPEAAAASADTGDDAQPGEADAEASEDSATGTIGYITDDYDHFSRDTVKIAYICNYLTWAWNAAISENLEEMAGVLNYEYAVYSANDDFDLYINQIEVLATQGYEGFILGIDDALAARSYEVCQELGVAFIAESTPYVNEDGSDYWISVQQDQYNNGAQCVQWLADNYQTYWGDIDTSTLGLLVLDYSAVSGITARAPGCEDTFKELFPDAADNYIHGDLVSVENGFSAAGGQTLTSTTLVANGDIEHWFVVGLVDDWAQGATRGVEELQKTDSVLIASVQADAFLNEMATGYDGDVYVSACAVSSAEFALNMVMGIVTILEGRATAETLWPEWQDGDPYASMKIQGTMITKDTYQQFLDTHTVEALTVG